jgi:glycosyltransferase involved in cell wall biosynthesis
MDAKGKPVTAGAAAPARRSSAVTVTIILTNYNHGRYLETSLGAITGQDRPADEIIVIDDGSTDNSIEVIRRFAAKHANLRVLENGTNRGVQYSIASALSAATSDWVVWAAADDKLMPNFLSRSVEAISLNPDIGIVFSRLATFRDDTGAERHYTGEGHGGDAFRIGSGPTVYTPAGLVDRLAKSYLWISGNTVLVRRDKLATVGDFVPALEWHSDWFAFYAVALRYGACGIPETLAMMRVVPNTYSASGMNDPRRQAKVMDAILDLLRSPGFADLRVKFRARPCLFSPFAQPMLRALLTRPRDWDLLVRLASWAIAFRNIQYRSRSAITRFPRGMKTRALQYVTGFGLRILSVVTPKSWKEDLS